MKTKKELTNRARELRQNSTHVEKIVWYYLRNRRLLNCKFRRQQTIGNYIVDFVCIEMKLIVELDGGQHSWQTQYDAKRTKFFNEQGFKVLRYWNNEVVMGVESVLEDIYREIEKLRPSLSPHIAPSP